MSVTIKTVEMQYRGTDGQYHGINAVAEKRISDQIEAIDAALADKREEIEDVIDQIETEGNQAISDMQTAAAGIDEQAQTMMNLIAAAASAGTDPTLTTSGMAADAAATGTIVQVTTTEPTYTPGTVDKLWVYDAGGEEDTDSNEYEIPTYEEFSDLKSALTKDNNMIAADANAVAGSTIPTWSLGYIPTPSPGTLVDLTTVLPTQLNDTDCVLLDVTPGEKYIISGKGGTGNVRLLGVYDNDSKLKARSAKNEEWYGIIYTIPEDCVKLVMNANNEVYHNIIKYSDIYTQLQTNTENIADIEDRTSAIEEELPKIEADLLKKFDLSSTKSIVLLGDSITHGYGSSDFSATGVDLPVSVHATKRNVGVKCWGNMFVDLMANKYGCTCLNNGVSEFKIEDLDSNLDVLIPSATDYCILMIGTNNRNNSNSSYLTRMETLITDILAKGVKPYVFSTIPVNSDSVTMAMKQQMTRKACENKNVPFFPMYSEFESYVSQNGIALSSLFTDTLHPNDRGYEMMFGIFRKLLCV